MPNEANDELRFALHERFDSSADWRDTKASEYPDDARNAGAQEELRRLRDSVADVPGELISSYVGMRDRVDSYIVSEIEGEAFRSVGFRSGWESATEFLKSLHDELARKAGLDLQQMDPQGVA